jgi:hypothetical protein
MGYNEIRRGVLWRDVMMQRQLIKVLGEVIVIYSKVSFFMRRSSPTILIKRTIFSIGWTAARHQGRRNIRMTGKLRSDRNGTQQIFRLSGRFECGLLIKEYNKHTYRHVFTFVAVFLIPL